MARSTPAQNPRGPARTISATAFVMAMMSPGSPLTGSPLLEVPGYAPHADVRLESAVGLGRVSVGDVLETITAVESEPVGHEHGQTRPGLEQEREVRVDLGDAQVRAAGGAESLQVGHHAS